MLLIFHNHSVIAQIVDHLSELVIRLVLAARPWRKSGHLPVGLHEKSYLGRLLHLQVVKLDQKPLAGKPLNRDQDHMIIFKVQALRVNEVLVLGRLVDKTLVLSFIIGVLVQGLIDLRRQDAELDSAQCSQVLEMKLKSVGLLGLVD